MPRPAHLLLLLLGLSCGLAAQQPTNERILARAELSRSEIDLGDQVTLTVNISVPPGAEVGGLDPAYVPNLAGLEVLREGKLNTVTREPELLLQQQFLVTTFDTGYVAVPPLPYLFVVSGRPDTVYTNDLLITSNALPVQEGTELQPIKPIIREPRNWLDFWWLYLIVLLGAGGYALYRYRQNRQPNVAPPPPPPPAHVVALGSLRELEARQLWQREETKTYYSELTRILRTYLADRFEVPAPEMTTRQLTERLQARPDFEDDRVGELNELLQLSDLVKFAKARPAAELHPASLERVRTFVETTAAAPAPPAADPPAQNESV